MCKKKDQKIFSKHPAYMNMKKTAPKKGLSEKRSIIISYMNVIATLIYAFIITWCKLQKKTKKQTNWFREMAVSLTPSHPPH